jgi:hypothetical protein
VGLPTLHGTAPIPPSPFCRPARRPRYRVGSTYPDPSYPTRHQRYRVGHHVGPTLQDLPCTTYPAVPRPKTDHPPAAPRPRTESADLPYTAPPPPISAPAARGRRPALGGLPYCWTDSPTSHRPTPRSPPAPRTRRKLPTYPTPPRRWPLETAARHPKVPPPRPQQPTVFLRPDPRRGAPSLLRNLGEGGLTLSRS